jgi:hypothetical protein
MEHQRGVDSCIDVNVSEVDRSEINPETLDILMTIKEYVAGLATLICISRVVDIKDSTVASRVVCVGASEICEMQCLGLSN